ncbi:MarR family transcriptional regulator [Rhodobacteraceae bacterium]|jgi:DNA-binding MarR family transcriptional regulator|nr:MarR family transcriptional regulator [Paracoccaceae bacterium]|tara:strand:+ start:370 stop:825 length:456 start_codon:yes stop_codon:yes gene_type:complete
MQSNPPDDAKTRVRAWLKILKTSNFIEKNVRERLRIDHQTTLPRFDVMSALYRSKDGLKMSELSGVLKVSNGNITGIIDRLVQDGHVKRTAIQGDRRAYLALLTKKGSKQFQEYALEHEAWINEILSDITIEEANTITKLLTSITDNGDLK